jgi:hypothetical protein
MQTRSFIGLDVHKETISISIAEDRRNGPVHFLGAIPNLPDEIAKFTKRLSRHGELDFCYEPEAADTVSSPAHGTWAQVHSCGDLDDSAQTWRADQDRPA